MWNILTVKAQIKLNLIHNGFIQIRLNDGGKSAGEEKELPLH